MLVLRRDLLRAEAREIGVEPAQAFGVPRPEIGPDPAAQGHDAFARMRRQLQDYARKQRGQVKTHEVTE